MATRSCGKIGAAWSLLRLNGDDPEIRSSDIAADVRAAGPECHLARLQRGRFLVAVGEQVLQLGPVQAHHDPVVMSVFYRGWTRHRQLFLSSLDELGMNIIGDVVSENT